MLKFVAQPDDLREIDGARQRRRSSRMRVPFAHVTELMQRGFDGGAHGGLEPDDAALEALAAPSAVFRLGQGVHDVNGLAAHVGDAEKHAARFTRQPAVAKPRKFGKKIVVVGDRPFAEGHAMRAGRRDAR